jgi:DNA invertase Pin-like site-specific DNA recombinase
VPTLVAAYTRVSTREQAESGAGLAAQRAAITREVERRGWTVAEWFTDEAVSGKSSRNRPGLSAARDLIDSGGASVLMASKLDRLSRSTLDFSAMLDAALADGWQIMVLDLGVDMSAPAGEFMASVMAAMAQWERRIIGQRTRDALEVRKNEGVRLGRPTRVDPVTAARIDSERAAGRTFRQIGHGLERDKVPTPRGGAVWHASTVRLFALHQISTDNPRRSEGNL